MFSSAKFLSPIVTAGLPTPGPLLALVAVAAVVVAGVAAVVLVVLLVVDVLEEPHAASTSASAPSASVAESPLTTVPRVAVCLPIQVTALLLVLPRMRCLLFICIADRKGRELRACARPPCRAALTRHPRRRRAGSGARTPAGATRGA